MIKRVHSALFLCKDLKETSKFYEDAGFEVEKASDALRIKFGDFRLAFMDESTATTKAALGVKGIGISIYFEVIDVNDFYQSLIEKGINTQGAPKDTPWGKRELAVTDPDGYKLVFYSTI